MADEPVPEAAPAPPPPPTPAEILAADAGGLPGVISTQIDKGEVVVLAERDALYGLMSTLCDDPRFSFEQVMDICGVDWPEREERFDVV